MEEEELTETTEYPLVATTPDTQDYYVLASDLSGSPLLSIPKWVWIGGIAAGLYWLWKRSKNTETSLIEESEED